MEAPPDHLVLHWLVMAWLTILGIHKVASGPKYMTLKSSFVD